MTNYFAVYVPHSTGTMHVFEQLEDVLPLLPAAALRSTELEQEGYHVLVVNRFGKSRCDIEWYRNAFHPPECQVNVPQPFGVEPRKMGVIDPDSLAEIEDKQFRGLVALLFPSNRPQIDPSRTFWLPDSGKHK